MTKRIFTLIFTRNKPHRTETPFIHRHSFPPMIDSRDHSTPADASLNICVQHRRSSEFDRKETLILAIFIWRVNWKMNVEHWTSNIE
jgi:hypothetical protein